MVTGIQSRAYGLNIEFHIELRFRKKKKKKVVLCHGKTHGSSSTRLKLGYAQPVVIESSILGTAEA